MSKIWKSLALGIGSIVLLFAAAVWGAMSSQNAGCIPFTSEPPIQEFETLAARALRARPAGPSLFALEVNQMTSAVFSESRLTIGPWHKPNEDPVHPWGTADYILTSSVAGQEGVFYFDKCGRVTKVHYPRDWQGNLLGLDLKPYTD